MMSTCTRTLHLGYKPRAGRRRRKETKIFPSRSLCCKVVFHSPLQSHYSVCHRESEKQSFFSSLYTLFTRTALYPRCAPRVYTACKLECAVRGELEHGSLVCLRFICTENLYGVLAFREDWF
uniref:(northern house mosquito) hypothetical protein n=1 Tax=Culex pipiens TaxID=7175 RepID=A0A8D8BV15_CULPI